jgi:hypothetical protein
MLHCATASRSERDGIRLSCARSTSRYASKRREGSGRLKGVDYFRISLLSYPHRHDPKAAEDEIKRIKDFDSLN